MSATANNFELNKGDQFIVGLDVSGSMQMRDCPGNTTRFDYVLETMKVFIAEASKWDPDGVSFYVFNAGLREFPDVASVQQINETIATLRPGGGTATQLAIRAAYAEHKRKGSEQTFLLLFTDGEPSDPDAVKQAVIDITQDVKDEKEFRIAILTVGERSPGLNAWLTDLDDHLTGAKFDIIDVEKLEDVDFERAVANAIDG
jgi:hypothetical protein